MERNSKLRFARLQHQFGLLDEQTLTSYLEPLKLAFNSNAGREFLLNRSYSGDPDLVDYVIEHLGLRD